MLKRLVAKFRRVWQPKNQVKVVRLESSDVAIGPVQAVGLKQSEPEWLRQAHQRDYEKAKAAYEKRVNDSLTYATYEKHLDSVQCKFIANNFVPSTFSWGGGKGSTSLDGRRHVHSIEKSYECAACHKEISGGLEQTLDVRLAEFCELCWSEWTVDQYVFDKLYAHAQECSLKVPLATHHQMLLEFEAERKKIVNFYSTNLIALD